MTTQYDFNTQHVSFSPFHGLNKPRWYPQQQKIWETWQELVNNYIKFQPWWQTTPEAAPKFPFDLSDDSSELFDFWTTPVQTSLWESSWGKLPSRTTTWIYWMTHRGKLLDERVVHRLCIISDCWVVLATSSSDQVVAEAASARWTGGLFESGSSAHCAAPVCSLEGESHSTETTESDGGGVSLTTFANAVR